MVGGASRCYRLEPEAFENPFKKNTVTPGRHTCDMLDLILPLECGGCGVPSTRWCDACAVELSVPADKPHVVNPRVDPQVPVFALGRYAGARRQVILAMKERGRGDLVAPLARALAIGVHRLLVWGMVEAPLTIVPRRHDVRRRGGAGVTPSPGWPGWPRCRWPRCQIAVRSPLSRRCG